ncbi:hypothetical protein GGI19_005351 [Coemansia pectinata]|uniref:Uncharacterized protein n=1 Tax=Coemansia pectinata TaxID=1052879 RepID=A0A9W8GTW3_9FUNG|nr:hypothetical protein GGI19_005351 [Coemansia pectinata]
MDSPRSLFQTLPMLLVRKVVEYLEGRSRASFDIDISKHNERKAVLNPLLLVSERWRAAALESICDNCTLSFNYSSRAVEVAIPAWPADFSYPRFRKSRLVKRVVVPLYLWKDMCDGAFCEALSTIQYENLSFPAANALILLLSKATDNDVSTTAVTTKEKVVNFARSLMYLAPVARSVSLRLLSLCELEPNYEQLYDALVSELYRGKITSLDVRNRLNQVEPTSLGHFSLSISLLGVSGLTSIAHGSDVSCAPFSRLAYLNATTLKKLDIEIAEEMNWLDLIYGGTEVLTVYSELESLSLRVVDVPYTTTWAAIEDVAPFPLLSTLYLSGGYPFDDDLVFRGNGGTLQNLQIPFSTIARNIMGRFNVLKRSGVTRMNRIYIGEVTERDREFVEGNAEVPIEQQIHRMVEMVATLKLDEDTTDFRMFYAMHDAPSTATLQHLELHNVRHMTSNLIKVLSAIPSLVSCSCNLYELGPSIDEIPADERPSRLRTKYYPMGSNFKTWRLLRVDNKDAPIDVTVYSSMLLAVLCPNFRQVDLPLNLRNDFGRKIAWATFNDPFKPYAESVGRLVYREVSE